MLVRKPVIVIVWLIISGLVVVPALGQGQPNRVEWKAEPDAVKQLAEAIEAEGYSIRIPKNFEALKPSVKEHLRARKWIGPGRAEKGRPVLGLSLVITPPSRVQQVRDTSLEEIGSIMIGERKHLCTNWKQEKLEKGFINDREFVRVRWSGNITQTGEDVRGFFYVTRDGENIVYLVGQDNATKADHTLPEIEAAVLTFRKP